MTFIRTSEMYYVKISGCVAVALFFLTTIGSFATNADSPTTGLILNNPGTSDDYTLFSPNTTTSTYLIDKAGNIVNEWQSDHIPGINAYLIEDGSLVRASKPNGIIGNSNFQANGSGGLIERFDWDGNKTWEYSYDTPTALQHHDIEVLPNGNVLLTAWDLKSQSESIQAGRNRSISGAVSLYPDHIVEVEPDLVAGEGGTIVWEWHVWDHLVQEYAPSRDNYYGPTGVEDHPELIDLNYDLHSINDFTHVNGIDYNAELDQIVLSVRQYSEFWIIDHSTTTEEATGHTGGNSGKGGDLLYRWGNPEAYDTGDASDRNLYNQHDAKWVDDGYPGDGNITVFSNRLGPPPDDVLSAVLEVSPPVDGSGNYSDDSRRSLRPRHCCVDVRSPTGKLLCLHIRCTEITERKHADHLRPQRNVR